MIDYIQLFILGGIAGFTIFIGLPFAALPAKQKFKSFINSVATGILFFILFDVLDYGWSLTSGTFENSLPITESISYLLLMFFGLALGLIGLAFYQSKFMNRRNSLANLNTDMNITPHKLKIPPSKLSLMIAIGIGVHNLSEGLAIGQSFAQGEISLALLLIIGFGAHNATEGFGIIAPLVGSDKRPSWSYIIKLGLIGGGPTFLGTIIGSFFVSNYLYIFFLALAAGALIFVILIMNNLT